MAEKIKLEALRHSTAHLLAAAVLSLYPRAKITLGPAIEDGFYYDIDFGEKKISNQDLPRIENKMKTLIKSWSTFKKIEVSPEEARNRFKDNPYKLELIDEIEKKGEPITLYQSGDFVDLCRGGHIDNPQKIKYFKLLSVAGAYWRGDEKNKMITRIYGTAFFTKKDLDQYLWQLEEAKKRDHRLLGKKLGLYLLTNEIGGGLLIWTPKGALIRRQIENLLIREQSKRGYLHVYTPHIGRRSLWQTSGHWDLYRDKMYAPMKIDEEDYLIKPMNCPFHMMIFKSELRSYKELPLRIAEIATVYRYEKAGELSGMLRVRHITQDDAHIFCRPDQIIDEFVSVFELTIYLMKIFGVKDYYLRLGLRSPKEKYLGNDEIWLKSQNEIEKAIKKIGINYIKSEGDAAFYGPKLDVIIKDSLGRQWQCGTIQIDFMLPERFNLEYITEDGQKKQPILIHRAPLGSLERFVALLIEHYAGAFPLWLAPIQLSILPISDRLLNFAQRVKKILEDHQLRAEINKENKTLSYKLRQSILQKIPYQVIIGNKEVEKSDKDRLLIAVRSREGKDLGEWELNRFINFLKDRIEKFY